MRLFEEVARDAGKAIGDCGGDPAGALVLDVARRLAELAGEPGPPRKRRLRRRREGPASASRGPGGSPR